MKSLAVSVLTAAVLIGAFSVGSRGKVASQERSDVPWKVGQCYRIFTSETDKLYTFRVLEPPQGTWVRVKQVPETLPFVPGGPTQAPLWVNMATPFAIQEWTCKG
jgi:hypothetical protein